MQTMQRLTIAPELVTSKGETEPASKCPFTRFMRFFNPSYGMLTASKNLQRLELQSKSDSQKEVESSAVHAASIASKRTTSSAPHGAFKQSSASIVFDWIVDYVAKPNAEVGRQGPVCPFLPRTLKEGCLAFREIHTKNMSEADLDALIRSYSSEFLAMQPTTGKGRLNRAIVLTFEDIDLADAVEMVEARQTRLKRFFVQQGLMLGEFHQNHNGTGIRNPQFHPLRSPVPMLVIRHMIPSDLMFLLRASDSTIDRLHFLKSYLRSFSGTAPSDLIAQARRAAALLRAEVLKTGGSPARTCGRAS